MQKAPKRKKGSLARRNFMKSAGVVGAAVLAGPELSGAASQSPRTVPPPTRTDSEETGTPPPRDGLTIERSGADYMVDVLKSIGFEYVPFTPANDFVGLQESLTNYGANRQPELITCLHEEAAVAMAHGYYKVEGKPLMTLVKGDVGLLHAGMAIHNAFRDRVPVFVVLGSHAHNPMPLRDYVKFDSRPQSLAEFAMEMVRAYRIAMTPPYGPVALVVDSELQEGGIPADLNLPIPKLTLPAIPVADSGSVAEIARLLIRADHPVIIADKLRTAAAMPLLVELAETLQAKIVSQNGLRTNVPNHHPLHRYTDSLAGADLVIGLETPNFAGVVRDVTQSSRRVKAKTITITAEDFSAKPRYAAVDLAVAADAEATLPALIEAVRRLVTPERKTAFAARGARFAEEKAAALNRARSAATYAWDASPISTMRLSAELWDQFRHEDWAHVGIAQQPYWMEVGLWNYDKPYRSNGSMGGGGLGYGMPAAVGAALAHKKHGRLCLNSQTDGDFMFSPTILWTAAKYQIPLLTVMRNNRAYHQEVMEVQRMCNRMNRGIDRASIGCELGNPNIDYAKIAQGMGVYAEGPIDNPKDLAPAIKRAIAVIKRGEPALLDVLTQPR